MTWWQWLLTIYTVSAAIAFSSDCIECYLISKETKYSYGLLDKWRWWLTPGWNTLLVILLIVFSLVVAWNKVMMRFTK